MEKICWAHINVAFFHFQADYRTNWGEPKLYTILTKRNFGSTLIEPKLRREIWVFKKNLSEGWSFAALTIPMLLNSIEIH